MSFLEVFFNPGEVFEIRALGLQGKGSWSGYAKDTVSGYFNDISKAMSALEILEQANATGIYFTLNPVVPSLIARANNRLVVPKATTTDEQILCSRWLLIDTDPIRPTGISSTEGELEQALETSSRIAYFLQENKFPDPITANSGNGAHLLYRLPDLPNTPEITDLKRDTLRALAGFFDNKSVQIDQKVFNASRITKAYGTMTRKGDSTEDRPHRRSSLESVPGQLVPATLDQLRWLAVQGKKEERPPPSVPRADKVSNMGNLGPMDVQSYLRHYGVEIIKVKESGPGTLYCLRNCVFNSEHSGNEAAIVQRSDGQLLYQCFHNSCQGRTWNEARKIVSGDDSLARFCAGYQAREPRRSIKQAESDPPKNIKDPLASLKAGSSESVIAKLKARIATNKRLGRIGDRTGFEFFDKYSYGLVKKMLWIIGAYTSHGKSAMMTQIIYNSSLFNKHLSYGIFSTEMSAEQMMCRLAGCHSEIPSLAILKGLSMTSAVEKVDKAFEYLQNLKLFMYDDLYAFPDMAARAVEIKETYGLDIMFVDFLQNVQGDGTIYERMSRIPVLLQQLAKELDICVIGLSQVSNESVKSDSKIIGYKGAGEIAAAADLGILLEKNKKDEHALTCVICKNRHGPCGKTEMRFSDNFTRIIE